MNFIPNPLHPALVHFPIALILLGTLIAIPAVFLRRFHLPWISAIVLGLGAIGAVAATWSGEEDGEKQESMPPQAKEVLDEHEEWGERARNLALLAAAAAIASAALRRSPVAARSAAGFAALAAIGASMCVAEAGHYGGKLVYQYGVGMNSNTGQAAAPSNSDD
ncbi:MAG: DUF2231 domain-containing protein [Luteolibacter sp.]